MTLPSSVLLSILTFTVAFSARSGDLPYSVRQSQTGEWADCSVSGGVCINVNRFSCSGRIATRQCPGGSNILCCRAPGGIPYRSCASRHNGLCKKTSNCPTATIRGLCPGPFGITCCPRTPTAPNTSGRDVRVASGIYLERNPPAQRQFRARRRSVKAVIVVHTAEKSGIPSGTDSRAENTANFIRTRRSFGSYHLLGDTDSIIQLIRFENAAFHDRTGSNEWSIGISLAMRAGDWPRLDANSRTQLVHVTAQMAAIAARWFVSQGVGKPAARQLTKVQSNQAAASGFISHAARDPSRRSDPGPAFPWADFLNEYAERVGL